MTSAIIGLVGVVIGGLIATWTSLFLESRRERRAVRAAVRLVQLELRAPQFWLRSVLWDNEIAPPLKPFSTAAWEEHKALLAASLTHETWFAMEHAIATTQQLQDGLETTFRIHRADFNDRLARLPLEPIRRGGYESDLNWLELTDNQLEPLTWEEFGLLQPVRVLGRIVFHPRKHIEIVRASREARAHAARDAETETGREGNGAASRPGASRSPGQ